MVSTFALPDPGIIFFLLSPSLKIFSVAEIGSLMGAQLRTKEVTIDEPMLKLLIAFYTVRKASSRDGSVRYRLASELRSGTDPERIPFHTALKRCRMADLSKKDE